MTRTSNFLYHPYTQILLIKDISESKLSEKGLCCHAQPASVDAPTDGGSTPLSALD